MMLPHYYRQPTALLQAAHTTITHTMMLRGTGREFDESSMEQRQAWSEGQQASSSERGERSGRPGERALCSCELGGTVCSSPVTSSSSSLGPPSTCSAGTDWRCNEHGTLFASTTALPAAGPALPSQRTFGLSNLPSQHTCTRICTHVCTSTPCTRTAHAHNRQLHCALEFYSALRLPHGLRALPREWEGHSAWSGNYVHRL